VRRFLRVLFLRLRLPETLRFLRRVVFFLREVVRRFLRFFTLRFFLFRLTERFLVVRFLVRFFVVRLRFREAFRFLRRTGRFFALRRTVLRRFFAVLFFVLFLFMRVPPEIELFFDRFFFFAVEDFFFFFRGPFSPIPANCSSSSWSFADILDTPPGLHTHTRRLVRLRPAIVRIPHPCT